MKKTLKKMAVTISAAVMCALPMANAFSASAAQDYRTFRVGFFVKWDHSNVKTTSITRTTKKGLTHVTRTKMSLTGDFDGKPNGSGGQTYNTENVNWKKNTTSYQTRELLYNETYKTTYGDIFESYLVSDTALKLWAKDANGNSANERITYEAVVVGDATGGYNTTQFKNFNYDGITNADYNKVNSLITAHNIDIRSYAQTVDFDNPASTSIRTLRAMMAADVNNDGWVTDEDARAIKACAQGKISDLSVYTGLSAYQMDQKVKKL
ncbi:MULTISPECIES: hypothetical protein [Ruminococcus]|uniref:Dockerin domain-containing protein n=1 Tax=Ruminococcus flavefaciens TaxID=1265 RepID=A0A1M7IJ36_RUMFL|nr:MULTISPECIES: hypothetical protein [Ruminococcus]MCR4795042.1 hypothetical protein [Ruminococcus sp.]SHM40593.1 hypothetical protein SAMN04487860_104144 [Ruminococcus flavefaciens]